MTLVIIFGPPAVKGYAATDARGLIFTFVWAFDDPLDRAFVDATSRIFTERGIEGTRAFLPRADRTSDGSFPHLERHLAIDSTGRNRRSWRAGSRATAR